MNEPYNDRAPDSVASWQGEPDLDRYRRSLSLVNTDAAAGIRALEALGEIGSVRSMVYLGYLFDKGERVERDPVASESWYRRATAEGAVDGWYYLGRLFWRQGAYDKALAAFERGADLDHVLSINRLALMYFNGLGVRRDLRRARALWERASSLGHLVSRRHMAILSLTGRFGISQIPRGLGLLWSVVRDTVTVTRRDEESELLSQ